MTNCSKLPSELQQYQYFCAWRYEQYKGDKTPRKVPYSPVTGQRADCTKKSNFSDLSTAVNMVEDGGFDGIGVGIFDRLSAIDIDNCIDEAGNISTIAKQIMHIMAGCYIEKSPSGRGVRLLFYADGVQYDKNRYFINNRKIGVEVYVAGKTNRFVTVTGNTLTHGVGLVERGAQLQQVLDRFMVRPQRENFTKMVPTSVSLDDAALLDRIRKSKRGGDFNRLWNGDTTCYSSLSQADIAMCNMLAFWCGNDPDRIDRIFRQSKLLRPKWDEHRGDSTYGRITIEKAIETNKNTYNPEEYFRSEACRMIQRTGIDLDLTHLKPEKNERYSWSDMGNGYLFADCYKDIARYSPERKQWMVYDGRHWVVDVGNLKVMEMAKLLANALMKYALSLTDKTRQDDYMKHVVRWQQRSYRETILKDASGVYPVRIADFDVDPFLFNCFNGTLNLQTREFHAHTAKDMLSKLAGVNYDPDAKSERWERFIDEVMESRDKAAFLQKSLGYSLTGDTSHECFFILYGPTGRNGKGTTMETVMQMMGEYGRTASPNTIAQKQRHNGSGPSEDIARLSGARFVNISEPDNKMVLSSALVKTLTGKDKIVARFLNENSFEYHPVFKLWVNTNYLPAVTDPTLFSSGRVKIIPFNRHFLPAERDERLKAELSKPESLSAVLNWCIEGLKLIEETGFDPPEEILVATDEYRHASDKIARFLEDEMEQDPQAETRTRDVHQRYCEWCRSNGYSSDNATAFKTALANAAHVARKRPRSGGSETTLLVGYRLKPAG